MSALAGAMLVTAGPAGAAYSARVQGDTLRITGDGASDTLALRAKPGVPAFLDVDLGGDGTAEYSFNRSTFTAIDVAAGGGDDTVRVEQSSGSLADEAITINGGAGADTLRGAVGDQTFLGGAGDDDVSGGDGDDKVFLGGGADTVRWNPGDDNDTIEGQGGADTLDFFGANANESITLSADGGRLRFFRNIASVVLDAADVERVNYHAFGGADAVVVNDLAGTGVKLVHADLNAPGGGPDGQADTVTAFGTNGNDRVTFSSPGGFPTISGLAAQVLVESADPTLDDVSVSLLDGDDTVLTGRTVLGAAAYNVDGGAGTDVATYSGTEVDDGIGVVANGTEASTVADLASRLDTTAVESLVVLGLGGADTLTAVGNLAALTTLTLDGGEGSDIVRGGNGADLLLGGAGQDLVDGNQGNDRALLGADDDTFQWGPGDGSDTVEGQAGTDVLQFSASNAGEAIEVTANDRRTKLTRNIAGIVMDFDGLEDLRLRLFGGADTVLVGDLARTGVASVDVDLSAGLGGGDGAADTITVQGTSRRDNVQLIRSATQVLVDGLPAQTRIGGSEAADTLVVQTLDGRDAVTVAPDVATVITPIVDLGAGQ